MIDPSQHSNWIAGYADNLPDRIYPSQSCLQELSQQPQLKAP